MSTKRTHRKGELAAAMRAEFSAEQAEERRAESREEARADHAADTKAEIVEELREERAGESKAEIAEERKAELAAELKAERVQWVEIRIPGDRVARWHEAHQEQRDRDGVRWPKEPGETFEEWIVSAVEEKLTSDLCSETSTMMNSPKVAAAIAKLGRKARSSKPAPAKPKARKRAR